MHFVIFLIFLNILLFLFLNDLSMFFFSMTSSHEHDSLPLPPMPL
jgi:hypothetical protein